MILSRRASGLLSLLAAIFAFSLVAAPPVRAADGPRPVAEEFPLDTDAVGTPLPDDLYRQDDPYAVQRRYGAELAAWLAETIRHPPAAVASARGPLSPEADAEVDALAEGVARWAAYQMHQERVPWRAWPPVGLRKHGPALLAETRGADPLLDTLTAWDQEEARASQEGMLSNLQNLRDAGYDPGLIFVLAHQSMHGRHHRGFVSGWEGAYQAALADDFIAFVLAEPRLPDGRDLLFPTAILDVFQGMEAGVAFAALGRIEALPPFGRRTHLRDLAVGKIGATVLSTTMRQQAFALPEAERRERWDRVMQTLERAAEARPGWPHAAVLRHDAVYMSGALGGLDDDTQLRTWFDRAHAADPFWYTPVHTHLKALENMDALPLDRRARLLVDFGLHLHAHTPEGSKAATAITGAVRQITEEPEGAAWLGRRLDEWWEPWVQQRRWGRGGPEAHAREALVMRLAAATAGGDAGAVAEVLPRFEEEAERTWPDARLSAAAAAAGFGDVPVGGWAGGGWSTNLSGEFGRDWRMDPGEVLARDDPRMLASLRAADAAGNPVAKEAAAALVGLAADAEGSTGRAVQRFLLGRAANLRRQLAYDRGEAVELLDDGLTGWRLTCGAAASAPGGGVLGYGAFWGLQLTHPLATGESFDATLVVEIPAAYATRTRVRTGLVLSAELNQVPANWAIVATNATGRC